MWIRTRQLFRGGTFVLGMSMFAFGSQVPETEKQRAVSGWSQFVGTWTVMTAEGVTSTTTIVESHPGVFVHRGGDFTVMVGWDEQTQSMHAFGFSSDDRPFEQYWELVDDKPTFAGRLVGTDQRFLWTIVDGVWTMDFGRFGKMTATRAK